MNDCHPIKPRAIRLPIIPYMLFVVNDPHIDIKAVRAMVPSAAVVASVNVFTLCLTFLESLTPTCLLHFLFILSNSS